MGKGAQLENYKNELRNIIRELESIEDGVRRDFKNIGNDRCADSIQSVVSKYQSALTTLNSVSPSHIDQMVQAAADAKAALSK